MIQYVFYKESTGEITGHGACPDYAFEAQNAPDGIGILIVDTPVDFEAAYVSGGSIVTCPKRPTAFHYLQDGQWQIDPDTAASIAKKERFPLLNALDWMTTRHRDQQAAGTPTSLTEEQYIELLAYKQALRDWPTSGDYSEPFPAKPNWLT